MWLGRRARGAPCTGRTQIGGCAVQPEMPIRAELRPLYLGHWPKLSRRVRFERAGGECERCGRLHGAILKALPDGRWFDPWAGTWRDGPHPERNLCRTINAVTPATSVPIYTAPP